MIRNFALYSLIVFYTAVTFLPVVTKGQTGGIHFESALSWKDVRGKAKRENKYIFVDCYATWCGPCKWMNQNVFSLREVGDFANAHFISVAVQMDKTLKDDRNIRDWYNEADSLRKQFDIESYPTYLFFSPEGEAVHIFIGSTKDGQAFIDKAGEALDSSTQYFTKMHQWKNHQKDTAYLHAAYISATGLDDKDHAMTIASAYLDDLRQQDLFLKSNLKMIANSGLLSQTGGNDKWFHFFADNAERIDDSLNGTNGIKHYTAWCLSPIIFHNEIKLILSKNDPFNWEETSTALRREYPNLGEGLIFQINDGLNFQIEQELKKTIAALDDREANWDKIETALRAKYPDFDFGMVLWTTKAKYYKEKGRWSACAGAAYTLIHRYGDQIDVIDMNNIVWDFIFEHSGDQLILKEALKWMQRGIERGHDSEEYLDTYANLLYKLGDKTNALIWENRAIRSAIRDQSLAIDLKSCQSNLEKMQKGEPTWSDATPAS